MISEWNFVYDGTTTSGPTAPGDQVFSLSLHEPGWISDTYPGTASSYSTRSTDQKDVVVATIKFDAATDNKPKFPGQWTQSDPPPKPLPPKLLDLLPLNGPPPVNPPKAAPRDRRQAVWACRPRHGLSGR